MKKLTILVIGMGLVLLNQKTGFSYFGEGVGARALGMGGTFVAVAEGIDSCFWNPAGLGNIKESELTIMRTMNNREITTYHEWLAAGTKLGDYGGIGVNYVQFKAGFKWYEKETDDLTHYAIDDEWVGLAFGGYGTGQFQNVAMGVNIRKRTSSLLVGTSADDFKWSDCPPTGHTTDVIEYDVGILYHVNKEFSLGLIVQNLDEPVIHYGEDSPIYDFSWKKIIKPGLAYRPDDKTIFAIDIYDWTLDNVYDTKIDMGQSGVRVGFEKWYEDKLAIRAGLLNKYYHTIGFGVRGELKRFFPELKYDIDYALLQGGGAGTHFLSCTVKF
ncbi:MAG: hypothetical protein AB1414_09160 [bacterium]